MDDDSNSQRKYIRLNSCFPVEFSLYFISNKPFSKEYQAYTQDVSKGGLCIRVKDIDKNDLDTVLAKEAKIKLFIDLPIRKRASSADAEIVWIQKDEDDQTGRTYKIGLSYLNIDERDRDRIFNYARHLKWVPRIKIFVIILLLLSCSFLYSQNLYERAKNKDLVNKLIAVLENNSNISDRLHEIKETREISQSEILKGTNQIVSLKNQLIDLSNEQDSSEGTELDSLQNFVKSQNNLIQELQIRIKEEQDRSEALKRELENISGNELLLEEQLADISFKKNNLQKASVDKMRHWLRVHQTRYTGLILSYEGDNSLRDWGFTYDQALACLVFLEADDIKRAENILDFFIEKAENSDKLFYNAYCVKTGTPCEYIVHSGPNAWIGIAACQYIKKTKDLKFMPLAVSIAKSLIDLQLDSDDGSIRGGPYVDWISTEHNLDAYAFFNMLYTLTSEELYNEAALKSLKWLKNVGYNKPEERLMRGKGDATIATDTFSWAVAAIGPALLLKNGMNPDGIMEFAESECKVTTAFVRPEKRSVRVTGFDFSKPANLGRGGIVSTEWTGQMIVSMKNMAEYYRQAGDMEKQKIYASKADYYLTQLSKMVISSPSPTGQGEGCLPYASLDNVDTGHGWRVAKGSKTGSVSGTCYYIFAYEGFNPLTL